MRCKLCEAEVTPGSVCPQTGMTHKPIPEVDVEADVPEAVGAGRGRSWTRDWNRGRRARTWRRPLTPRSGGRR